SARSLKLRSSATRSPHLLDDARQHGADFASGLLRRALLQCPDRHALRHCLRIAVARDDMAWKDILAGLAKELIEMRTLARRLRVEVRRQQPQEFHIGATIALLHADHGLKQPLHA